ncbi:MAG TPA: hypothetical protein VFJ94_16120 [Intrasporangium sp.]|uniref:hypothetical protein n=1 Tax=Intrasporangium sp. TaxID=1925024 RepID=UPI002D7940E7|nr:hypothetical protein [Intrasporangium sp.]HET7400043.1 hypothetical protein [Intrasporangium sp.]
MSQLPRRPLAGPAADPTADSTTHPTTTPAGPPAAGAPTESSETMDTPTSGTPNPDPTPSSPDLEPTSSTGASDPTSSTGASDPTSGPALDPTGEDPHRADTEHLEPVAPATPARPAGAFRVEPAAPVPDDVVLPDPSHTPVLSHPGSLAQPPVAAPGTAPLSPPPPRGGLVTVRTGPRPGTILLGLLSLLVAGYVLVANLGEPGLQLRVVGPGAFGALGGALLLVGLVAALAGNRRR